MPKFRLIVGRLVGNGSHRAEVANWLIEVITVALTDPHLKAVIDDVIHVPIQRFPTNIARNELVDVARAQQADFMFMVDDDVKPPEGFFKVAVEFLIAHRGPAIIACPYVTGGDGREDVCVFEWAQGRSGDPDAPFAVTNIVREDAARRSGIERVPNIGTSLIAYRLDAFSAFEKFHGHDIFFDYAYDPRKRKVVETEDCWNARHMNFAGVPIYVHWDFWALHRKSRWCVKPVRLTDANVGEVFIRQARAEVAHEQRLKTAAVTQLKVPANEANESTAFIAHDGKFAPLPIQLAAGPPIVQLDTTSTANGAVPKPPAPPSWNDIATAVLPASDLPDVDGRAGPMAPADAARWAQGIEGWMAPEELLWLAEQAAQLKAGDVWIEVGSWKGRSASAVYLAAPAGVYLVCIDTWDGRGELRAAGVDCSTARAEFAATMQRIVWKEPGKGAMLYVRQKDSLAAAVSFLDGTAAVVFIDGSHDYDSVCRDLEAWAPKVRPGGLLAGHDRNDQGVARPLRDVLATDGYTVQHGPGTLWYVRVPAIVACSEPVAPLEEVKL